MNRAQPNLQISIHKVDGTITKFVQHDAGEVKRILDSFLPAQIFDRDRFVITDENSITSFPVSKITRIDLVPEQLTQLVFPSGIVDAVELSETEFETLVHNPMMREQWGQMRTNDDSLVTFLDLEMADRQRLLLTTEMHVTLQSEVLWDTNWFPLEGSSLCFRMRSGGVSVLNLANLVRLTFFPKPVNTSPDVWHARQFPESQSASANGNPTPIPFASNSKPTNFQAKKSQETKTKTDHQ